ncbi:MAG: hypothetical protein AMXMBFR64_06800 [Myxococcales bacterium]
MRTVALVVMLAACGSSERVVPKEQMVDRAAMEREAAAREAAQRQQAEAAAWKGPTAKLGEEIHLVGTGAVKLEGTDLVLQLVKTSWTTVETPRGKSRKGTARLMLTKGDAEEIKDVQIDEGKDGLALGLRIEVSHAHEAWDDRTSGYLPEAKVVVTRP